MSIQTLDLDLTLQLDSHVRQIYQTPELQENGRTGCSQGGAIVPVRRMISDSSCRLSLIAAALLPTGAFQKIKYYRILFNLRRPG